MNAKLVIAIVFFMLFVGMIANAMYPGEASAIPGTPGVPGTDSGTINEIRWWAWPWDVISNLITLLPDPVGYMFESIGAFIMLMTFQLAGVPVVVNTLLFVPFAFGLLWLTLGMVRGSQGG